GAMIVLDLRLVGVAMRKQSTALLARNLEPYMTWGLIVMLGSGFLLFTSEAMKCYVNEGFRFKMAVLVPAVLFSSPFSVGKYGKRRPKDPGRLAGWCRWCHWSYGLAWVWVAERSVSCRSE